MTESHFQKIYNLNEQRLLKESIVKIKYKEKKKANNDFLFNFFFFKLN